jgi:predicted deacylase
MSTTVFSDIDWERDGKQVGTIYLPHSPDDDAWGVIPFPAASIKNGQGPVVVVSGAVHGDEYEGPIVIAELMRQIQASEVAGQLILLPTFNAPALRAGRRTSPIDHLNLNRVFPGDDHGLPTQQIARYVTDHILSRADFYLDLHAGGADTFYSAQCSCGYGRRYAARPHRSQRPLSRGIRGWHHSTNQQHG